MSDKRERIANGMANVVGRRTMLSGIGASGLAVAATLFSRGTTAMAGNYVCCNLAFPNNNNWADCSAHPEYIWGCTDTGGFLHCSCCERYAISESGATCQYN